jgi:transcriptional regulator with XRE-family HTH domain
MRPPRDHMCRSGTSRTCLCSIQVVSDDAVLRPYGAIDPSPPSHLMFRRRTYDDPNKPAAIAARHPLRMTTKERASDRGRREASRLIAVIGSELREARLASGLSQGVVARAAGLSHPVVSRIERGLAPNVPLRRLAVLASVLGLRLSVRAYPVGLPIRDAAQVALIERLRAVLHPSLRWRAEVPIPIEGDLRAWDGTIQGPSWTVCVDAETRIQDAQVLARRTALKQRDSHADRVLLLVADTRANREIVRAVSGSLVADPLPADEMLQALRSGRDPGGNGVILLRK